MSQKKLKLTAFKFDLPEELLASYPYPNRDESRMMVIDRKNKTIEHKMFTDLMDYFDEGDTIVFNNSKVFPARLHAKKEKTKADIEIFLLRELDREQGLWDVLVDPARKIRIGNKLYFKCPEDEELTAEIIDNTTSRGRSVRFLSNGTPDELRDLLFRMGETPLPKYIKRKPDEEDIERYQTIYAEKLGSVAAPTAGLHFTKNIFKKLEIKGVNLPKITLHVGLGTFKKLEVEDLNKYRMDAEYYNIDKEAAEIINNTKKKRKKVCAVGTTTVRALETSLTTENLIIPKEGWTNIFIYDEEDIKVTDSLLTNFHLPASSLLVMVCAFAGYDFIMEAYQEAMKEKYRFFSYGDCMLIL